MSRVKYKYTNGQSRGGIKGKAVDSHQPPGRAPKNYHRQAVAFHGGDMAYERWVAAGRKGYYAKE